MNCLVSLNTLSAIVPLIPIAIGTGAAAAIVNAFAGGSKYVI